MLSPTQRRWSIFVLSCSMFVLSQFYRASIAVISPNLINDLRLDPQSLGLISAAFFYAFALMQIPVAFYLDSVGPRFSITVLSVPAITGALMFAWGESVTTLTIARVMLGVGMACNFMGPLKLLTCWFSPKRFAVLAAVVVSVGTGGSILATTPLVLVVQAVGWRVTFVIIAVINTVLALIFGIVVKNRPPDLSAEKDVSKIDMDYRQAFANVRRLFSLRDFWLISVGTFGRYGIYASIQALWAGPFLLEVMDVSQVMIGNLLLLMSLGVILGGPVWGWVSDHWVQSRKKAIIPGVAIMAVILIVLQGLPMDIKPFILAVLFFSLGIASGSGQIMYTHIKERMPLDNAGLAMTGINFFTMAGVGVFLHGLGSGLELFYPGKAAMADGLRMLFLFCGIFLILIAILYSRTRESVTQRK